MPTQGVPGGAPSLRWRWAMVANYVSATSCSGSAKGAAAGFRARVVVITITLTSTSSVPSRVLGPTVSPPRKYPTITATTGLTYA